jgi:hypothetical protein
MRSTRLWEVGGFISGAVLILFGAGALYLVKGVKTVFHSGCGSVVLMDEAAKQIARVGHRLPAVAQAFGVEADGARVRGEGVLHPQRFLVFARA